MDGWFHHTGYCVKMSFGVSIGMIATHTPGHTQNATDFVRQRTLESHGEFFRQFLKLGMTLASGQGPKRKSKVAASARSGAFIASLA